MEALAALSGTQISEIPRHGLTAAVLQVKLTDAAVQAGATWAQVGATQGLPAKLAKRNQKVLAARVARDLLRLRNSGAPGTVSTA
jgi:hypothetical protein